MQVTGLAIPRLVMVQFLLNAPFCSRLRLCFFQRAGVQEAFLLGGSAHSPEQSPEQGNAPSSKQKPQVNVLGGGWGMSGSAGSSWERLGWGRARGCWRWLQRGRGGPCDNAGPMAVGWLGGWGRRRSRGRGCLGRFCLCCRLGIV